jgi:alkylation response protein AidB-like acyl-CoA dehydrogenase
LGGHASNLSETQRAELRGLLAAEALGAAEECFRRAFEHAQIRIAYGRPISAFQAMRHLIADMHTDLDFAKTALYWALHSEGEENRTASTLCAQMCTRVGGNAFHIFGGMAFTWDLGLHLYQRHIEAVRDLVAA